MNLNRKATLRRRYLKARSLVYRRLDQAPGCGIALLSHISTEVSEACRVMDEIEAEVKAVMKEEGVG